MLTFLTGCGPAGTVTPLPLAAAPAVLPKPAQPAELQPPSGAEKANAAASSPAGSSEADWPKFLGPTGDSKSSERGIRTDWTKGLPILWELPLQGGYTAPVVSAGKVFVADRQADDIVLSCRQMRAGNEIWRFAYATDYVDQYGYDGGPRSSPLVVNGRVFLFGPEGMLHGLDAQTGKLLWKVDTTREFGVRQNFFGVGSSPVGFGDLVLVAVGGSGPDQLGASFEDLKGNDSAIVAFDQATGAVRYQLGNELASYSSPVTTTINGQPWGFLFARGGLLGFDPQAGKERFFFPWRAPILESVNAANPVVVGNQVLITESYDIKHGACLLQIEAEGPQVVWRDQPRTNSLQAHFVTPIYHQGYVYGCSSRHSGQAEVRCVEWATGKVRWRQPGLLWTSLLYVDNHFVLLSEDGTLRLLQADPASYRQVAEWIPMQSAQPGKNLLKSPAWAAPILADGLLYVRGKDRLLCCELIPAENAQPANPLDRPE